MIASPPCASISATRSGLVHGPHAGRDKDAAMERFASGEHKVLVSTTVIEVGVDVSAASVMIIEHAERFGLAQLHQLRGRVGRGTRASTCLLLYKGPLGPAAKARLEMLRETEDGFRIAEEDLRLRGEGEVLGTRQSGLPGFKLARLDTDGDLLAAARDDARLVIERDPQLVGERGRALRLLLYLFEREAGVKLLRPDEAFPRAAASGRAAALLLEAWPQLQYVPPTQLILSRRWLSHPETSS
jgi:ATP-dependent DNA helicase RecG